MILNRQVREGLAIKRHLSKDLQERRAEQLRELGFNTVVVDSMEGIEKFLLQYSGGDALDKA